MRVKSTRYRHAKAWALRRAARCGCPVQAMASRRVVRRDGAHTGEVDAEPSRRDMAFDGTPPRGAVSVRLLGTRRDVIG